MILTPPSADEVEGVAASLYAADIRDDGRVFAHTAVMALNPEAELAFETLASAIVRSIGLRTYELATLAAARAIGSRHCLLAHGRRVLDRGVLDEDQLIALLSDEPAAGLSEAEWAVVRFATRLSTEADGMSDADSRELRDRGFSDRQILDIALAAAVRNYYSRPLLALGVPVEEVPRLSDRARDALLAAAEH